MPTVLIVDDDRDICNALRIYLSSEQYEIKEAHDGRQALRMLEENRIDLVLMDIMMPGMDGIEATVKLREKYNVPVILLTAKSEEGDKILGLNVGADDYVTKPFNPAEVVARVRSQLRRYMKLGGQAAQAKNLQVGGIVLDDDAKQVTVDGEEISLTPMEYGILKLLMENPGRVYSSSEIYELVWKDTPLGSEGTVAVHIRHIREKIEIDPSSPRYIKVIWGQGYKMERVS